jgi:hypothetical protein
MEIIQDRATRTILLTQRKYTIQEDILNKTKMAESKPKELPLDITAKISKEGDDKMENPGVYAEVLGMLLYLSTNTRLGIRRAALSKMYGGAKTGALVKGQAGTSVRAQDGESRADARQWRCQA